MIDRPPYRAALFAALGVLAGYVFTLAPSVTFWDAGEFIASMKVLGIPHPPGTPLFILLGHVWGNALPFGEFAWRTNLLSALFSATAAGFWFLIVHQVLVRLAPGEERAVRWLRLAGAAAGAALSGFSFTNWQNSNETEVYAVASCVVAAAGWLCIRWRGLRGSDRSSRQLLLIAYLLGASIANHLLALLAGPAVLGFLIVHLREAPSADAAEAKREWSQVLVLAAVWVLLLGVGLGNTTVAALGAVLVVGSAGFALTAGNLPFAASAVVLALIGVTPYLFLFLRSPQNPFINEAAPGTWDALLAVIRREQYPPRSPFDDPTFAHGPENPGRNLTIIGLQLVNYIQYFDWQWARGIATQVGAFPLRTLVTMLFLGVGLHGSLTHRKLDRSSWWFFFALWGATGLGLMAYMNFKPGFSVGFDQYPRGDQHEVRERDYFFVLSFVVWAWWSAIGLTQIAVDWARRLAPARRPLVFATFAVALIPVVANFKDADRGHGPDARLAGDFAYNMLNSVPPYGVLFTFGDNDTFPLWWAQEVEGIRQDVRVVCLALARTDWYIRQMRDYPERDFNPATSVPYWRDAPAVKPTWPLHTMTDAEIAAAVPQYLSKPVEIGFGPYRTRLDSNTVIYTEDFVSIRLIQQNFGRRPIGWGLTSSGKYYGLEPLLLQRGLGITLEPKVPDTADQNLDFRRMFDAPLDIKATEALLSGNYRYAELMTRSAADLETTAAGIAQTLAMPFTQLAFHAEANGDLVGVVRYLEKAAQLSTNPGVADALAEARGRLKANPDSALPKSR